MKSNGNNCPFLWRLCPIKNLKRVNSLNLLCCTVNGKSLYSFLNYKQSFVVHIILIFAYFHLSGYENITFVYLLSPECSIILVKNNAHLPTFSLVSL